MRIASVEISGCRAFGGSTLFDLKRDIVLVVGANGQGKTSLFDAVHWAITGQIARLRHPGSVVSLYSASGEARVEVAIGSDDVRDVLVTRRSDGEKDNLLVKVGGDTFHDHDAEYELLRLLLPDALVASEPREALRSALERGVYLQQKLLTDFLTAHTDQDRFNSISELIGAGRITEFQSELEKSRRAWSRVTNEQSANIVAVEERLDRLNTQLRELSESDFTVGPSQSEWNAWWTQAMVLGISTQAIPRIEASDAHSTIDVAMAELRALRFSLVRRGNRLRELFVGAAGPPADNCKPRCAIWRRRSSISKLEGCAEDFCRRRGRSRRSPQEATRCALGTRGVESSCRNRTTPSGRQMPCLRADI